MVFGLVAFVRIVQLWPRWCSFVEDSEDSDIGDSTRLAGWVCCAAPWDTVIEGSSYCCLT